MKVTDKVLMIAALVVCWTGSAHADVAAGASMELTPAVVKADLMFAGESVKVSAAVPHGANVAVLCTGKAGAVRLKRKGKVWGVLWMNTGEASFGHVPSLYQLSTSAPLSKLASDEELARLGLGYSALAAAAEPEEGSAELFGAFSKLKEREGTYALRPGTVKVTPGDSRDRIEAECPLPSKAQMGQYHVRVLAFDGGKLVQKTEKPLELRQVRLARFIADLARERGTAYGILAVGIAIIAGLGTGLLFGLKSSKKVH